MRISPLDIRKQSFKTKMRGVDAEEVRIFLELVASEFESVLQENAMMAEKLHYQEERLIEYRELEKSMRNSLVTAERIASESRDSSEREANRIVQEAHLRAERILEDARERLQALIREIETLKGKKEVYARRFWTLIEGQFGVLQEHMQESGEVEALRRRAQRILERSVPQQPDPTEPFPPVEEKEPDPAEPAPAPRSSVRQEEAPRDPSVWEPAPLPAAAPEAPPRGLRGLLRRQTSLPLPDRGREPAPKAETDEEENRGSFLPLGERREGIFEIKAAEGRKEKQ